ncbi:MULTISPECIES: hypothetical protein [unclassified Uliginosibacterium]|uniref:hypothetical protein n=1 Tax=unclassified Uliginosibacterium TaxID=2621521 RepID=UPI000C7DC58A|nr:MULTISPECIES: hypothetical protein [unclassified Uliginosibacterium]MDO6388363.1 hypothetical protein [Uliginosibacterium sp. 31-12]PLK47269.1 hypothetical protein C0V76_17720 [Uliginosibacterium sp. TH139]
MLILRLVALALALAIGVCAALGLLTRQPYFFRWAWNLFRYGLVVGLVTLVLLVFERLIAPLV